MATGAASCPPVGQTDNDRGPPMKMEFQMKPAAFMIRAVVVAVSFAVAGCAGRAASVESEPAPLTEEDYYGEYDLYFGGVAITEGQPAPMTAEWTAEGFVASQGGHPTIRTGIAIDPARDEIRLWDDTSGDVLCASEGVYAYEDDGTMITMQLISDPCSGRAQSADGARLVRR